jgi:hypothetical protein
MHDGTNATKWQHGNKRTHKRDIRTQMRSIDTSAGRNINTRRTNGAHLSARLQKQSLRDVFTRLCILYCKRDKGLVRRKQTQDERQGRLSARLQAWRHFATYSEALHPSELAVPQHRSSCDSTTPHTHFPDPLIPEVRFIILTFVTALLVAALFV